MRHLKPLHFLVLLSFVMLGTALTPSSYLSAGDKEKLRSVFKSSLALDDLPSIAYSVLGFNLLGEMAPDAASVCKKLQESIDVKDIKVAAVYQATVAAKALDSCKLASSSAVAEVIANMDTGCPLFRMQKSTFVFLLGTVMENSMCGEGREQ